MAAGCLFHVVSWMELFSFSVCRAQKKTIKETLPHTALGEESMNLLSCMNKGASYSIRRGVLSTDP